MYGNLECSSNKQLSGQPGEYSLNKCLVAACSGVKYGCSNKSFEYFEKTHKKRNTNYLNKSKLRAPVVTKRVSEYPVIYGKESKVLSLMLVVEIVKQKDPYVLQNFCRWMLLIDADLHVRTC